jgi:hypothetical protein
MRIRSSNCFGSFIEDVAKKSELYCRHARRGVMHRERHCSLLTIEKKGAGMKNTILILAAIWFGLFFFPAHCKAADEGVHGKLTCGGEVIQGASVWRITRSPAPDYDIVEVIPQPITYLSSGKYSFVLESGDYEFVYGAPGCESDHQFVHHGNAPAPKDITTIRQGHHEKKDVDLQASCCCQVVGDGNKLANVPGTITNSQGGAGIGLAVVYHGTQPHAISSNVSPNVGKYSFMHAGGDYIFTYTANGFVNKDVAIHVPPSGDAVGGSVSLNHE